MLLSAESVLAQSGNPAPGRSGTSRCPEVDPIEFELPISEKTSEAAAGASVSGCAGELDFLREDYAVLSGGVEVRYQDLVVSADRVEVDLGTQVLNATGRVVLDQGPERVSASSLVFDLESKTGNFSDASAFVSPDYFFTGAKVAKVSEDVYTVEDGVFTSCPQEVPAWSFKIGKARVKVDGYAKVKNAALRVKKTPVLFTPYLLWPVKDDRTSGFLIPQPGFSERRGASLSLAYYQVLGRSYDTTFELDTWSEGIFALGNEFRYQPSENTGGVFRAYGVFDDSDIFAASTDDEFRWKVDWEHDTRDLPWGLRGHVSLHDFSDFEFFRDFERDFNSNSVRFTESQGFVTGNWGPHFLNILLNQRETFINPDRTIDLRKLPEIEYRLRPTKLGRSAFYLSLDSSLDYLSLNRSETFNSDYFRADLFPRLTLPVSALPWLSISLTAGQRMTFYGDSVLTAEERENTPGSAFSGESLTRSVSFGSAEIVGPTFSRIFDRGSKKADESDDEDEAGGTSGGRLKHVVEPRFTYTFLDDFVESAEVPLFDEVDALRSTNSGRFSLVNRILAKPAGDQNASAREILSFELFQDMSFDDDQPLQRGIVEELIDGEPTQVELTSDRGPLGGILRFNPRGGVTLKTQFTYNTLFDSLESTSVTGGYGSGPNYLGLTWFTRREPVSDQSTRNQVRLSGGIGVIPGKLRLEGQVNYDFELGLLQQQRYILSYTGSCCGVRFELRDFRAGTTLRDTDYRIAISLKNVGDFLDFTGGASGRP